MYKANESELPKRQEMGVDPTRAFLGRTDRSQWSMRATFSWTLQTPDATKQPQVKDSHSE